jgi:hypothetical protein
MEEHREKKGEKDNNVKNVNGQREKKKEEKQ